MSPGHDSRYQGIQHFSQPFEILRSKVLRGRRERHDATEDFAENRVAVVEPIEAKLSAGAGAHGEQRRSVDVQREPLHTHLSLAIELACKITEERLLVSCKARSD